MNIKLCLSLLALGFGSTALAQGVNGRPGQDLSDYDRGWYTSIGVHTPTNRNYITGHCDTTCSMDEEARSFFVFDLAGINKPIVAATLCLEVPLSLGYLSPDPTEVFEVHDYVGDINTLVSGAGGSAAFEDLGTGAFYGSRSYSCADKGMLTTIDLNEQALADMNASLGGLFAMGGRISTLGPFTDEYVFGYSNSNETTKLLIQTAGTECFMIVGNGSSSSSIKFFNRTWTPQVGEVQDIYVVSADELPEFALPPSAFFHVAPSAAPSAASGPGSLLSGPGWLNGGSFSVQVLMWNPALFPNRPIQWSNGLAVDIDRAGRINSVPFGSTTGMGVWVESSLDETGKRTLRFPFSLPGPREFDPMVSISPSQVVSR